MKKQLQYSLIVSSVLLLIGFISKTVNNNNARRNSSMEMPSGLQYTILKEGSGAPAKKGQRVEVHYTGWLYENSKQGTQFDSSHKRGQPFSFTLGAGQVILGWDEGVMGMKVDEKRQLIIPAALGYGTRGVPGVIPPNATLMFEVELKKIS